MLKLNGLLSANDIATVQRYTELRLKDSIKLKTPEALTLYEQGFLEREAIKKLCEDAYGFCLEEPTITYIQEDILTYFIGTNIVPATCMPMSNKIIGVYIPEIERTSVSIPNYELKLVPTTIYYFLELYQRYFGTHVCLQEIPAKLLLDLVVQEAIELGAADITISTTDKSSRVYYNVRKRKVKSNRIFSNECIVDVIRFLCAKSPYMFGSRQPKYVDVDFNKEYRGRIVINSTFKGYSITIRLLPNKAFDKSIDTLNLTSTTILWLKECFLDFGPGLRILVGPTMSGKNTTAISLLREIALQDKYKIVSVEMPVEQELQGIEQINTETLEEYESNIKTLIHQNPDFVYITEIRDSTGQSTVQIANTGKRVLSTLHSNSVADTISRLVDITNFSTDRIIQTLHSICYQELVRDDKTDSLCPKNRYIRFSKELKYELYGKSLGEIIKIISEKEDGDHWIR